MNNTELQKHISEMNITVSQAMRMIDDNSSGILFLTEENERLTGCITDGDIRRYLLSGGLMTDPAMNAANTAPRLAHSIGEAKNLYHKKNYKLVNQAFKK